MQKNYTAGLSQDRRQAPAQSQRSQPPPPGQERSQPAPPGHAKSQPAPTPPVQEKRPPQPPPQQRNQMPPQAQQRSEPPSGSRQTSQAPSQSQSSKPPPQTLQTNQASSGQERGGQMGKVQAGMDKMGVSDDMEISDGEDDKAKGKSSPGWGNCDVCGITFTSEQVKSIAKIHIILGVKFIVNEYVQFSCRVCSTQAYRMHCSGMLHTQKIAAKQAQEANQPAVARVSILVSITYC